MNEKEFRQIAQEELSKQIMENLNSGIIFKYINTLEERNKDLEEIEKEHKEENGRLREENKKLQEFYEKYYDSINSELNGLLTHKFIGYIPKSKIKEKMELLREDIQYSANPLSIDNSKYAIEVLEELLEESDK